MSGETEIAIAVWGAVGEFFHDVRGGVDRGPVYTGVCWTSTEP